MPFDQKSKRNMVLGINIVGAVLLLFGTIPVLNLGVGTPIVAGFSFGTLIGLLFLYTSYLLWKKEA